MDNAKPALVPPPTELPIEMCAQWLDQLTDGYWCWQNESAQIQLSSRLAQLLRYDTPHQPGRQGWLAAIHPEDRHTVEKLQHQLLNQALPRYECRYRFQRLDGQWRWLQECASVVEVDGHKQLLAFVLDVTEQHVHNASTMHERYEDFARSASDWFWETDPYLKLTFVSENLSVSTGIEVSQLLDQSLYTLMGPQQAGTRIQLQLTQPFRDTRIQLENHWISLSGRPFYDEQGTLRGYRGVGQDIHNQVLLEQEIRNVREGMDTMMRYAPLGVALKLQDGSFLHVNPHFLTLIGCERDELSELYAQHPQLNQHDAVCGAAGEAGERHIEQFEFEYTLQGERRIYAAMKFAIVQPMNGTMVAIFLRDISAERGQLFEQQKSALVFNHISEGLLITDTAMRILDVNQSLVERCGYSREQLLDSTPKIFQSGRHERGFYREMRQQLDTEGHWQGDIWNRASSGEVYRQHLAIQAVRDVDDQLSHYVAFYSSSQDNRARSDAQRFAAQHDPLTGLVSPLLFQDRLKQALARARRRRYSVSFFLLDLVKFRELNDQYGHESGDLLLKKLARRLAELTREEDTVCRWSADCFVVMLEDLTKAEQQQLHDKLHALCQMPFNLSNGQQLQPRLKIRQLSFPQDGATLNKISQRLRRELDQ